MRAFAKNKHRIQTLRMCEAAQAVLLVLPVPLFVEDGISK